MTRAQFLNDLYRRLGALSREQAEQHLTYYAEMLADRMEEGMTEEEAVASMEDIGTIAQRILQDEGVSANAAQPPQYPNLPRMESPSAPPATPEKPARNWRRMVRIGLWGLAILVAVGMLFNKIAGRGTDSSTRGFAEPDDVAVVEDVGATDSSDSIPDVHIGPDGIYVSDGEHEVSIGPDGFQVDGETSVYVGPGGIQIGDGGFYDWGNGGFYDWGDGWDWSEWTDMDSYVYAGYDCEVPVSGIKKIEIEWTSGMVDIAPSDMDVIQFREASTRELTENMKLVYEIKDKTLHISFQKDKRSSTVNYGKLLTLTLPASLLDELDVETTSAGVSIMGLDLNELDVETASGNVTISSVSTTKSMDVCTISGSVLFNDTWAGKLDVETTSGDVGGAADMASLEIETISGNVALYTWYGEKFQLDSVSGDLFLAIGSESSFSNMEVESTSGDVVLAIPASLGFTLTYDTSSGTFNSSDFDLSFRNRQYIYGNGSGKIDVDTTSGDLTLMLNE